MDVPVPHVTRSCPQLFRVSPGGTSIACLWASSTPNLGRRVGRKTLGDVIQEEEVDLAAATRGWANAFRHAVEV